MVFGVLGREALATAGAVASGAGIMPGEPGEAPAQSRCNSDRRCRSHPDCRATPGDRPSGAAFVIEGGAAAIALDVDLQDGGVVDEPVDGGERHGVIGEYCAPFAERLIGGDQQ